MKSFFENKVWVVLLAAFAFLGLVVLASGLGEMEFPQMFSTGSTRTGNPFDFSSLESANGELMRYLVPGLLLLIYVLSLGRPRPQSGDSLMNALIRALAFILFFVLVFGQMAKRNDQLAEELLSEGASPMQAAPELPELQPFSAPDVTLGSTFGVVGLLLLVLGVAAVFFINRAFDRLQKPASEMNEIADIARTALNALASDQPSKNVIIRSYLDMNAVVGEKRGLIREDAMTPAEFAVRLDALGLPLDAVHGLTGVFERVRYGGQEVGMEETEEAKRCLTIILNACETKK